MVDAAGHTRRVVPVVPRFLHRQHRAARHAGRSGRATGAIAVRGGGIRDRLRGVADHRWPAGGHLRTQESVPGGDRRVHTGIGAVWIGGEPDNADRLARPAGDDGGNADAAGAGDHPRRVRAARASVRDRTVRHVDGLCLHRGTGAGRGVGQHQPVRLVVAVDLPDQCPDRWTGDLRCRAGPTGVTRCHATHARSGRCRTSCRRRCSC